VSVTKRVALVTGGAGFIGSHMVDRLIAADYCVRVVDNLAGGHEKNLAHLSGNPDLTVEWRDIRDLTPGDALFKDVNQVFHFAGIGDIVPSIKSPADYMDVNVQGTVTILEGARAGGADRFVYAASSSCYGDQVAVPTREDHPVAPQYPYALSKYLGELSVMHWHRLYGMPVNSIRIFNAYGPRVRTTGAYGAVFGVFLKQKLANKPLTIVGDGMQRRDFVYVTDVAAAFHAAAETPLTGQIWNLGGGNPQTVNRLAELIGGETVGIPKRPGEPDCTWADITKIRGELDWAPAVPFETGVANMLADIGAWKDAPLWDPDSIREATRDWFQYLGGKS